MLRDLTSEDVEALLWTINELKEYSLDAWSEDNTVFYAARAKIERLRALTIEPGCDKIAP